MTPRGRPLALVAAVACNGVIGAKGLMPWWLPSDLARFRTLTTGHPLLMGRATYDSIGRPLPGRLTTVLSRNPGFSPADVAVAPDLEAALASLDRQADALKADVVMVVGGGAVYAATIALADRLLITEVDAEPEGDVVFPRIDPAVWHKVETQSAVRMPGDSCGTRYARWKRRAAPATHDDRSAEA